MRALIRLSFLLLVAASLSACISAQGYVDNALPKASRADVAQVAHPQPVQLLYEFRTRGTPNARATEETASRMSAVVSQSGLFTEVSKAPAADGHRLTIVIDNVPITSHDDAVAKGFGTGLTFGLVGTTVTDGYVCEATYSAPGKDLVSFKFHHALHTTIGNASGPPGLTPMSPHDAAMAIVDQLGWSIMRDLSRSGRL